MSLANKHRPQHFDEIVAQDHITTILKAQMKSDGKIHHNYIFFGPRGTGKTTAARILAKALNCTNQSDGNPCNQCDSCNTIDKISTLDYVEIDAASHTGVDNVREEIIDKINYPPTHLKKKIYVIDEVHMLSKGAFNALLKTIEEPKDNICFILATTEIHKIPDTIISRCQVFNFKKIPKDPMIQHLKKICEKEGLKYDDEALELITNISEGCARDAIKYVDQISILGEINQENVSKILGIASESTIADFLTTIKQKDQNKAFSTIDEISKSGIDLSEFAKQTLMYIDQRLNEDLDFYLEISKYISEILSKIKYYPYPKIIYKVVLSEYLKPENSPFTKGGQGVSKNASPEAKEIIDEKKEEAQQETIAKDNITEEAIKKINQEESEEPEGQNLSESEQAQPESSNIENHEQLLSQLTSKLGENSLSGMIKQHVKIKEIKDNIVTFIIINKATEIAVKNSEKKEKIEKILSEILGKDIVLEITYQTKEEFFKNGLL